MTMHDPRKITIRGIDYWRSAKEMAALAAKKLKRISRKPGYARNSAHTNGDGK